MLLRRVLLRTIDVAARFIFACTLGVLFISLAALIYLRAARVPVHDIASEVPLWYTMQRPPVSHVPATPALRRAAWRAQLDHAVDPVPQLKERHWWSIVGCGEPISVPPDQLFITCYASVTDCAVLYRCAPDGKLLWKSYDDRSP